MFLFQLKFKLSLMLNLTVFFYYYYRYSAGTSPWGNPSSDVSRNIFPWLMIQCHGKVFIGFTLYNLNYVLKYNWIHLIHTVHSTMFSLKKLRPLEDSNCLDWSSKKNYFYQATQTLDINFKQKISNLLRL